MNLFQYRDNLLSQDDFNALNAFALRRYPAILQEDEYSTQEVTYPVRSREPQFPPGFTNLPHDIAVRYGKTAIATVDLIRAYLIDECNIINPEIVNIWFAYMTSDKEMKFHCDGPVRDYPLEHTLTSCFYIHKEWEEDWGGYIETEDGIKISPMPNRLAVWSRDVIHGVSPIDNTNLPNMRMLMATTWTSHGRIGE
mgnify:CR=1 FL=1